MKQFAFKKLDAFAAGSSAGNPAGMITVESFTAISPSEMQRIAFELRGFVNEVGFVCRTGTDRLALRYYSAEREVLFCGHATIAILFDLLSGDPELRRLPVVHFDTATSSLTALNRIGEEQAVFIGSPDPDTCSEIPARADIALALGIDREALSDMLPPAVINAGLQTLLVPMASLETTLAAKPDEKLLKAFCEDRGLDIVTIFTDETARPETAWRSRVFAPRFGYLEDPATGSGNAALGHYLLQRRLWSGVPLSIEQNGDRLRPNIVKIMAAADAARASRVFIGGSAICRIEGSYLLQPVD